jgi:hypothetical protein
MCGKTVRITGRCGIVKSSGRRRSCWKKLCAESKLKMLETMRVEHVSLILGEITAFPQGFPNTRPDIYWQWILGPAGGKLVFHFTWSCGAGQTKVMASHSTHKP